MQEVYLQSIQLLLKLENLHTKAMTCPLQYNTYVVVEKEVVDAAVSEKACLGMKRCQAVKKSSL